MTTATSAGSRLGRLLALVPYLYAHPGVHTSEVAQVFGVTEKQLEADLELLFVCGVPGYGPGDLIDVAWVDDRITVANAEAIARPLRLSADEALALVVAARTLAAVPGLAERGALDRAVAKLESATADVKPLADRVAVSIEPEGETLARVRGALAAKRRLHLRYYSASRDDVTERDVDPMRLVSAEGRWYLEAYCRRVEDVRLFRLDRMAAVAVLDVTAEVPDSAAPRDLAEGVFQPQPEHRLVALEVDATARWVADYYRCETVKELPKGARRITLRTGDTAWLRRLALRLGRHVTVVDPPDIADDVRALAREALAAYGEK
ncbi:MAG: helix-turn-helix transcriptional regulator [Mycobacteriales bacterium]